MNTSDLNLADLRARGFVVIKGFCDSSTCRAARQAIDALFGPYGESSFDVPREALGDNGGHGTFKHIVSHPSPVLSVVAHLLPQLAQCHAASLDSETARMRLNGQHFIRTDPDTTAQSGATSWHVE